MGIPGTNINLPSLFFAENTNVVNTGSGTLTDLGGPSVTVNVPANALVRLSAYVEAEGVWNSGQTAYGVGQAAIVEDTDFPNGVCVLSPTASSSSYKSNFATNSDYLATSGSRTYTLKYSDTQTTQGVTGTSVNFRNGKIWVEIIAP